MNAMASGAEQACSACGESTAPGSPLFSDRRAIRVGTEVRYLCGPCQDRLHARHRRQLDDDELRRLVETGTAVAMSWRE